MRGRVEVGGRGDDSNFARQVPGTRVDGGLRGRDIRQIPGTRSDPFTTVHVAPSSRPITVVSPVYVPETRPTVYVERRPVRYSRIPRESYCEWFFRLLRIIFCCGWV